MRGRVQRRSVGRHRPQPDPVLRVDDVREQEPQVPFELLPPPVVRPLGEPRRQRREELRLLPPDPLRSHGGERGADVGVEAGPGRLSPKRSLRPDEEPGELDVVPVRHPGAAAGTPVPRTMLHGRVWIVGEEVRRGQIDRLGQQFLDRRAARLGEEIREPLDRMEVRVRALQAGDLDLEASLRPANLTPTPIEVLQPAAPRIVVSPVDEKLEHRGGLAERGSIAARTRVLHERLDDEEVPVQDLAVVSHPTGPIGLPEEPPVLGVAEPREQEREALLGDAEVVAEAPPVGVGECPDHAALSRELLLVGREQVAAVPRVEGLRPPRQGVGAELVDEAARPLRSTPVMPESEQADYRSAAYDAFCDASLWQTVDGMLARADVAGILAHELAPLAAHRLRSLGRPVPDALLPEEQIARTAVMTSIPLLRRVRDLADGPIVLAKGAEVAWLYPGRARSFSDLDLLAVESGALHESLKSEGFVEVDDPDDYGTTARRLPSPPAAPGTTALAAGRDPHETDRARRRPTAAAGRGRRGFGSVGSGSRGDLLHLIPSTTPSCWQGTRGTIASRFTSFGI